MASHVQYHENALFSWLPCIEDGHQPSSETGPIATSRRNIASSQHRQNQVKQTEELLASELNKLSVQERTEALADVHCVGEEVKETPEMIAESLAKFEELVQKERNSSYNMALNQNREYVENPSFRLRFLRSNVHNVGKAVRQMMNFLRHKANYFGNDKIARDITLADLNEGDMQVILSGLWHVQEGRDRSGRVIIHTFGDVIGKCRAENMVRAGFFIFNTVLLRDPAVQMKGMVTIFQNASRTGENKFPMPTLDFILKVNDASTSFPIRYTAMHMCLQTSAGDLGLTNSFLRPMLNGLPQYAKVRSRMHIGSSTEILYELRSLGIPMDTYPIDMDGNVRENMLNVWFAKYLQQIQCNNTENKNNYSTSTGATAGMETNHPATFWNHHPQPQQLVPLGDVSLPQQLVPLVDVSLPPCNQMWRPASRGDLPYNGAQQQQVPFVMAPSVTPSDKDVLLGRGKFAQSWEGNVKFREFLENQFDDYDKLAKTQRHKRTIELTQELMDKGIRFFEQKPSGEWVEADCTEARQKVSQMFRSLRKKKSKLA